MLSPAIEQKLNDHLNLEFASAHLYLSMSAYFESQNLSGLARWMFVQYQEEIGHTMKFFKFINDRDGRVELSDVPKPEHQWEGPLDVFKSTLSHERMISNAINGLVRSALEANDYATHSFLQWFVNEQVEEEATAAGILGKLELLGDSRQGLYLLDQELGQRSVTAEET
ncbi:ferritin [Aestuariirhabdus sp. Z084]|uniref:ferritin n=1 Tax=Aestuariirhabdus haliotis TaxID=2918751 RepID=UPI00201B3FA9|nr:ferritin [Aestuariirhabdus haliotis]MCL6414667.1 ferritin [Aestuariirhabdus haliotis]MCL6418599.1 ferritin [Aestuariirhabdus haliotis]